jgi:hypothetical protein
VLDIRRAVEGDPFADRVVLERARVGELARLDVDRHSREEAVAAAVVEMQVRVDDASDVAWDVLGVRRRAQIVDLGPRVDQPSVDEYEPGRVVDRPDEHGPALAVDTELRREVGADHPPTLPAGAGSGALRWRVRPGKWRLEKRIAAMGNSASERAEPCVLAFSGVEPGGQLTRGT